MRKNFRLLALLIFLLCSAPGCETIGGALEGGIEGARKDWEIVTNPDSALMRADAWIRENLW